MKKLCLNCRREFNHPDKRQKYCSVGCYNAQRHGENNPRWERVTLTCAVCDGKYIVKKKSVRGSKYCSLECKYKAWQKRMAGKTLPKSWAKNISLGLQRIGHLQKEKHPNWKGGISLYNYDFLRGRIQPAIKKRDGFRCRICNLETGEKKLTVHHVDQNTKNDSPENLLTICFPCHTKIHGGGRPKKREITLASVSIL
jgi:hypothetical protein